MARIGELDLCDRLSPTIPVWVTQVIVGLVASGATRLLRIGFDIVAGGAAPFALIYPAIMLATLFARAFAGIVAATVMILYIWYYLYPIPNSFRFVDSAGALSVGVVVVTALITIGLAELFRRAAYRATRERDREIADRDLFLAEFDHRMKNNFAIVAGLLDMQKRRATDPATAEALGVAQMRIDSIARAHRHLYRGSEQPGMVEMQEYLPDLCAALSEALFLRGGITLACDTDQASVPRDRAVSIGLVINELVTNAAKHAFPGRDIGSISVVFYNRTGGGWTVTVTDDGVGLPRKPVAPGPDHGLGSRLIEAFARQAGGTITTDSDRTGTRVTLELAA
ncbi:MAG: sensor histidine kinase [Pseudomonadota bacterium]|uniref:sensor histidine kinase n=1 Tax=Sphingomonas sp. ERG5 TaxID=1381597 RepID=UPI00054B0B6A|nr:sensor histidine kinase [Sphingomonas sp. ERG5]